jgi:hypothetical protein
MSEELTRFPITPEERHETAKSFDDVRAVPEENRPRQEEQPQDKPLPPTEERDDEDKPDPADEPTG